MKTHVVMEGDIRPSSMKAQTLRIDTIDHGDHFEWYPDLQFGSGVFGKVIYQSKREEIKQLIMKSRSRYLDVVRHLQGSR